MSLRSISNHPTDRFSGAVLEGGKRLITQSGFMVALGRARQAKGRAYYDADVNMPAFLTAKNLKPFIFQELEVTSSQIEFKPLPLFEWAERENSKQSD